MKPLHLYVLWGTGMILLFSISTVQYFMDSKAENERIDRFHRGCAAEGLRPSDAPLTDADLFCVGLFQGVPLVVSWYPGSTRYPTPPGVLVSMPLGRYPEAQWGMELSWGKPRYWGMGIGEETVRHLVEGGALQQTQGLPCVALMPWSFLQPTSSFLQVVLHHWPDGWPGLVLRNNLPRELAWTQIHQSLEQLFAFRQALLGNP